MADVAVFCILYNVDVKLVQIIIKGMRLKPVQSQRHLTLDWVISTALAMLNADLQQPGPCVLACMR